MKRILYMILVNFIRFPYIYFKLVHMAKSDKYSWEEKYEHIRKIDYYANKGGKVNIIAEGIENIPKENGYLILPNHQGMYDVLTIIATHEKPLSVIMKKELANIPMLKYIFMAMGAHAIDRDDVKQSLKTMLQAAKEVKEEKRNFIIFAEGTRSKEGNKVGKFKGGGFKCAQKAKCPILPVALIDAFKPFDENSIKEVTVQVHYLEPIYYDEYKDMDVNELAEMVQNRISKKIEEIIEKSVDK